MEQEFEEKFNQIYDVVSDEVKAELKMVKKIISKYLAILIIVAILVCFFMYTTKKGRIYVPFAIALSLMIIGFVYTGGRQIYRRKFKSSVIIAILNEYMDTLGFDSRKGFPVSRYKEFGLDQGFNDYYSEDQISGTLPTAEKVTIAEVRTKIVEVEQEKSGYTQKNEKELFHGMFGEIELHKSISARISLNVDNFMRKYSRDRIEVDSEEFESYFDLSSDNRILAMQIFTADLMEKILEIKKLNKHYNYELKIFGNTVFFRYSCGDLFEPPMVGIGVSRERVKEYFRNIYYPLEILKSLVENINFVNDVEVKNIDL